MLWDYRIDHFLSEIFRYRTPPPQIISQPLKYVQYFLGKVFLPYSRSLIIEEPGNMNIVLVGFMGTGKSAVGRYLAAELHVPFADVDATIAEKVGKTIKDIFAEAGEAKFRRFENETIAELAQQDKTVIATGGGALLDEKNREMLQRNGILVCLTARLNTLLERLRHDLVRPMLAGEDLERKVKQLMEERQSVYNSCPLQVGTDDETVAQVSSEIIEKVSPLWKF